MTLEELVSGIDFVYHLTSSENSIQIIDSRTIYSTTSIIQDTALSEDQRQDILQNRRCEHLFITKNDGSEVMIRDQKPISIKSLAKCVEGNWTTHDFIKHLNNRVFFWPNLKRLNVHFNRYENELPVILKCRLTDLIHLNNNIKLCHLNSGATRCHPKWNGAPPPRGENTFRSINDFNQGVGRIAEITFEGNCILPPNIWVSNNPNGPWLMQ